MSRFGRILVPMDFSPCARAALRYALGLAAPLDAKVEVLHAVAPPPYVPLDMAIWGEAYDRLGSELSREMDALLDELSETDRARITPRLVDGIPYEQILAAAEQSDLVVMGTHGRTGVAHLLMGSVAERVVRRAPCPVITVPQRAADGAS